MQTLSSRLAQTIAVYAPPLLKMLAFGETASTVHVLCINMTQLVSAPSPEAG